MTPSRRSFLMGAAALSAAVATPYGLNRRQFFDGREGRFYFYDLSREAYFWENGEPRD